MFVALLAATMACDGTNSGTAGGAGGGAGARAIGGMSGTAGMSGAFGTAGMAGTSGTAGMSGASGIAGMIGMSGASGTSGCVPVAPPPDSTMAGCPAVAEAPLGEASHPSEGATHLVLCSTACYATNPPSSGNHYPVWPVYKTYAAPVPWGFLVHGLEHGAIIVSYNCPCGCPDEVAAAQAWIDSLPIDTDCNTRPRVVLTPDPGLDVRWAASAWTWTLREQTFDQAAFQAFFTAHYNKGPEEICDGYTDGSATGWCQ